MLLALESLHVTRNSSDSAKITLRQHVKEEGKAIELRNYLNSEATEKPRSKGFTRVSKAVFNHTYEWQEVFFPFALLASSRSIRHWRCAGAPGLLVLVTELWSLCSQFLTLCADTGVLAGFQLAWSPPAVCSPVPLTMAALLRAGHGWVLVRAKWQPCITPAPPRDVQVCSHRNARTAGLSTITQREGEAPSRDVRKQQWGSQVQPMLNEQADDLGAGLAGRSQWDATELPHFTFREGKWSGEILRDVCSHWWKKGSRGKAVCFLFIL